VTTQILAHVILDDIELNAIDGERGFSKENINRHLITPLLKGYIQVWSGKTKSFWLVFDKLPDDGMEGYQ
jgi:hypothetical protein